MKSILAATAGAALLALGAGEARADGMAHYGYKGAAMTDCCQANWNGFYVAGSVGVGFAETEYDQYFTNGVVTGRNDLDIGASDITGTIAIGYDREIRDGIVVGIFGDYTFGSIESDFTLRLPDPVIAPPIPAQNLTIKYDDTWAVGVRLGLARSCCTLWYLTAGYTSTELDFDGDEERLDGYFLGGGVEQQLHHGWSLKLEYRYSDFGEENVFDFRSGGCAPCRDKIDLDSEIHAVRLGISYKFGVHRETAPAPLK